MPTPATPPLNPLLPHGPGDYDYQQVIKYALPRSGDTSTTLSMFDNYDRAMKSWLQSVLFWDGRFLPTIFSAPLRAFSTIRQLIQNNDPSISIPPPRDGQLDYPSMPLPFISYWRGDWKYGPRQNQNFPVRNIGFIDGTGKRRTGTMRNAMPINLPYQVELWCKHSATQGILMQQLLTQFWPKMAYWSVSTPYGRPIWMPIRMMGSSDTSELEGGTEAKDRVLRYTFSLEVEGRMFFDVMAAPTYMRKTEALQFKKPDGTREDVRVASADVAISPPAPPSLEEQAAAANPNDPEN